MKIIKLAKAVDQAIRLKLLQMQVKAARKAEQKMNNKIMSLYGRK